MSNTKQQKARGFTILETVISISIIGILGVIFANTLTQGLRSQNKATLIAQAKQNGSLILSALEKDIHGAERIICVGNNSNLLGCVNNATQTCGDTLVLKKGPIYSRYRFTTLAGGAGTIGLEEDLAINTATSDMSYLCSDTTPPTRINYLTNVNQLNGVSVTGGVFTRKIQAGFNDLVTITFNINAVPTAGQTVESSLIPGGVPFTTTVGVR